MKVISIIAPIYNEQDSIKELYSELNKVTSEYPDYQFKYVLVNDGSKDNSHKEILDIKDERINYIKFSKNFGKESALIAGLDYSSDSDAAIIVDSDLEMPLHHIHEMIEHWEKGTKLVICRRANRDESKLKGKLASKFYDVYSKATGYDIVSNALDYTCLDKQVINEVIKNQEVNRFFKGIIASVGFDYEVIDIEMTVRENGESSFGSFSQLFKYAIVSIAIYTKLPLYTSIYVGIFAWLISVALGIKVLVEYFMHGVTVAGYSSIMCVMLFFFGLLFIMLGVIGFYIGLILDESKGRTLYIIDEVYIKAEKTQRG